MAPLSRVAHGAVVVAAALALLASDVSAVRELYDVSCDIREFDPVTGQPVPAGFWLNYNDSRVVTTQLPPDSIADQPVPGDGVETLRDWCAGPSGCELACCARPDCLAWHFKIGGTVHLLCGGGSCELSLTNASRTEWADINARAVRFGGFNDRGGAYNTSAEKAACCSNATAWAGGGSASVSPTASRTRTFTTSAVSAGAGSPSPSTASSPLPTRSVSPTTPGSPSRPPSRSATATATGSPPRASSSVTCDPLRARRQLRQREGGGSGVGRRRRSPRHGRPA